ncbi:MAG: hypothetical protein LBI70_03370 [Rickettsiales bacterium]|nr:hypothetical protein [Rickettsiales bacterium]
MNLEKKYLLSLVGKISLNVFLVFYFVFHVFSGRYGLFSYRNMDTLLLRKKDLIRTMEQEANRKRNKIDGLKREDLDMDLFEEEIRRNVGLIDGDEIVIIYDNRSGG